MPSARDLARREHRPGVVDEHVEPRLRGAGSRRPPPAPTRATPCRRPTVVDRAAALGDAARPGRSRRAAVAPDQDQPGAHPGERPGGLAARGRTSAPVMSTVRPAIDHGLGVRPAEESPTDAEPDRREARDDRAARGASSMQRLGRRPCPLLRDGAVIRIGASSRMPVVTVPAPDRGDADACPGLHETIETALPLDEAFAFVADFANASRWDPGVATSERIDAGPVGVGARYRLGVRMRGRVVPMEYRITAFEPADGSSSRATGRASTPPTRSASARVGDRHAHRLHRRHPAGRLAAARRSRSSAGTFAQIARRRARRACSARSTSARPARGRDR